MILHFLIRSVLSFSIPFLASIFSFPLSPILFFPLPFFPHPTIITRTVHRQARLPEKKFIMGSASCPGWNHVPVPYLSIQGEDWVLYEYLYLYRFCTMHRGCRTVQ
ncbi:hypothetical protein HOY80DRAFT_961035 [Tuber brumale]|nr:hypothetical protein HOY80DRAFT_961035 [Tuber brumale]